MVLFLLFDSLIHIANTQMVREAMAELGFAENLNRVIGVVLLVCLILYIVPATSILGAVLLTGYLGGAVATNMLTEQPIISTTLFPIYVASSCGAACTCVTLGCDRSCLSDAPEPPTPARQQMPWTPNGIERHVIAASRNSAYESSIATASRQRRQSSGSVQSPIPMIPAQEIAEIRSAW